MEIIHQRSRKLFDKTRLQGRVLITIGIMAVMGFAGCVSPTSSAPRSNEGSAIPATISNTPFPMEAMPSAEITATVTSPPVATATMRATATERALIPSPTPIPSSPTQSADGELRMVEALHSKDRRLPCYLGITPGKTSLSQAKAILDSFGASSRAPYTRQDGAIDYHYYLIVGDPGEAYATSYMDKINLEIGQGIDLWSNGDEDEVQIIEVYLSAATSMPKFQKYWERYSPQEIFRQYGQPDQIYAAIDYPQIDDSGYILYFIYEELGVVIQIYPVKQRGQICPQFQGKGDVCII